jgi:hypothetical protein
MFSSLSPDAGKYPPRKRAPLVRFGDAVKENGGQVLSHPAGRHTDKLHQHWSKTLARIAIEPLEA